MKVLEEILKFDNGSKFVRADLHIHSYGRRGSYDVTDESMTPKAIVDTAINSGLNIISITDHNCIGNIEEAIEYASGKEILVIPGIEISTIQGHLLIYSSSITNLESFVGKLNISEDKKRCTQGIVDCLDIASRYNCIGILAHIEDDAGFEKTINRFGPAMEEIIKHSNLFGFEIKNKSSKDYYTSKDINDDRKRLINLRKTENNLDSEFELPKLMSSDSHTLDRLGTNAEGEKRLTRVKVNELSFESFKIALQTSSSRIRIEDFIPERIPHFIGIKLEGGLLDGQIINLSKNLNCIIGGRGAGKSTLLESLRTSSGNTSSNRLVDSEVWPDKITLLYEDEAGKKYEFVKNKFTDIINITDPSVGITKLPIESYGQGETAETIQHSDEDPKSLLKLLDGFLDLEPYYQEDKELRDRLYENQSEIVKLNLDVNNTSEIEKLKSNVDSKLNVLKKDKVGDIVKYQESLIKEREFRENLINELKILVKSYKDIFNEKELFDNIEQLDDKSILVGKEQFLSVKNIVNEFSKIVQNVSSDLQTSLDIKIRELKIQLQSWKSAEGDIQGKIDEKKKELEAKGIPFDLGLINKMAKDAAFYDKRLNQIKIKKKNLVQRIKERKELLNKRIEVKNRIYYERQNLTASLNNNLKDTIADLFIKIKFNQGVYSPNFQEIIKSTMGYRTTQVKKAKILAEKYSPFKFIEIIKSKNVKEICSIKDGVGNAVFSNSDAQGIIDKFSDKEILSNIETIEFDDRPEIKVTKEIIKDGNRKFVSRDFTLLSLGQQQSILLAILLHSKSKVPLIIDQPEDNLDSEFIYKTIVRNLRKIKEKRQVIVVTHNSNIGVLGDAELILPLKSSSIKSMILKRGSIDKNETKTITCDILEGGEKAFKTRKDIYGI